MICRSAAQSPALILTKHGKMDLRERLTSAVTHIILTPHMLWHIDVWPSPPRAHDKVQLVQSKFHATTRQLLWGLANTHLGVCKTNATAT